MSNLHGKYWFIAINNALKQLSMFLKKLKNW